MASATAKNASSYFLVVRTSMADLGMILREDVSTYTTTAPTATAILSTTSSSSFYFSFDPYGDCGALESVGFV